MTWKGLQQEVSRGLQRTGHREGAAQEGGGPEYVVPTSMLLAQGPEGRCRPRERLGLTTPPPLNWARRPHPQEPPPRQLSQAEDFTLLLPDPGLEAPKAQLILPASSLPGQETEAREGRGFPGVTSPPSAGSRIEHGAQHLNSAASILPL